MTRKPYVGKVVTVSFDPNVCEHSGNCVRGLLSVFDTERKPWRSTPTALQLKRSSLRSVGVRQERYGSSRRHHRWVEAGRQAKT